MLFTWVQGNWCSGGRGRKFRFCVFTGRSTLPATSGGDIFLCVKKDIEERHAKGLQSRPLETGFFIRGFGGETCVVCYVFAVMQFTRFRPVRRRAGGVRFARLRRKAKHHLFSATRCRKHCFRRTRLYCFNCGENVGTLRITNLICSRKLGGCGSWILLRHCEPVTDVTGVAIRSPLVSTWSTNIVLGARIATPVCALVRNDLRKS